MKPVIGITMGDPAGIGSEILLKSVVNRKLPSNAHYVVFGDYKYLEKSFNKFFSSKNNFSKFFSYSDDYFIEKNQHDRPIAVVDYKTLKNVRPWFGRATPTGGYASGVYIEGAVKAVMNHKIDSIVTLPINKEAFWLGGWGKRFPGHTEMLANLARVKKYAIMLVDGPLRAIHVTSHIPLRAVPSLITTRKVADTISLAIQGCQMLGIKRPRVAVCGLNPHAGDGGVLGNEEKKIIQPAIRQFTRSRYKVTGPFPADTMWPKVVNGEYDIGVAMFHDQGQIPLKFFSFQQRKKMRWEVGGVNVTIGLPFVRTSVMHGTAYEIAGKGFASTKSFLDAIKLASRILRTHLSR